MAQSKSKIIFILVLILGISAVAYAGWYRAQQDEPNETLTSSGSVESEEEAKGLALQKAQSHTRVDFTPERTSSAQLDHPFFEGYYFIYVWSELGHSENSLFVVSPEGDVWMLPEEFNELAQDAELMISTQEEAQGLLEFYLRSDVELPGAADHVVLSDIGDVSEVDENTAERYNSVVAPMKISSVQDGWAFEFYTWYLLGGRLFHWKIDITQEGEVQVKQKEILEKEIGNFGLPE